MTLNDVLNALDRQARAPETHADNLARMHDYSAEFPAADAEALRAAATMLLNKDLRENASEVTAEEDEAFRSLPATAAMTDLAKQMDQAFKPRERPPAFDSLEEAQMAASPLPQEAEPATVCAPHPKPTGGGGPGEERKVFTSTDLAANQKLHVTGSGFDDTLAESVLARIAAATPASVKPTNPKDAVADGRVPLALLSPIAKAHWALAQHCGRVKYGAWNWREAGARASVYLSAIQRHADGYLSGETNDPVDGTHHLGNIMACCAILLEAEAAGKLTDDRPPRLDHRTAYASVEAQLAALTGKYADRSVKHWTLNDGGKA